MYYLFNNFSRAGQVARCCPPLILPTSSETHAEMSSDILSTPRWQRRTHVIPASIPATVDTSVRHELASPLRLSVHDYHISGSNKAGFTAILTHGTSFNKYFWELIVDDLVDGLAARGLQRNVKRLIALDAANHGDSALLNKGALPVQGKRRRGHEGVFARTTLLTMNTYNIFSMLAGRLS